MLRVKGLIAQQDFNQKHIRQKSHEPDSHPDKQPKELHDQY
jgi:hypothetical protein